MIYLILTILCSVIISVFLRLSGKHVKNEMGMFMSNYVICIGLSLGFMEQNTTIIFCKRCRYTHFCTWSYFRGTLSGKFCVDEI